MEENNCRCCAEIEFWKKTKSDYLNFSVFSKITRYGWKRGKKKIVGFEDNRISSDPFPLKYCPQCGKKICEHYVK